MTNINKKINIEIAEESKYRYFCVCFDENEEILFYIVFTKKQYEKNHQEINNINKIIEYKKNNYDRLKVFYESEEKLAYYYFKRG
jgi:hypothetical protein